MEKSLEISTPLNLELPSEYSNRMSEYYASRTSDIAKKEIGQFFTPLAIAYFMASINTINKNRISILDPGCGTGILSISLIEHLISKGNTLNFIELTAYETDVSLISFCRETFEYLKSWLQKKKISFIYKISQQDFVIEFEHVLKSNRTIFNNNFNSFDYIISNPPYFKLSKEDKRTKVARDVVNGHANIYSIFMAIAASLLKPDGQLVFITPRSFSSGNYFHTFRNYFFKKVDITQVHLFHSRKNTFSKDKVLQETLILKCIPKDKTANRDKVIVTSSNGLADLNELKSITLPSDLIMDYGSNDKILFLPTNQEEREIVELFKTYKGSLNKYGFQISTGPVVAFRATDIIKEEECFDNENTAPLFWLHNVSKMELKWPIIRQNKGQFISVEQNSFSSLVPNKNYLFLRRFSSKDDKSRLIAAPYFSNAIKSRFIGIENKLNYIYKPKGHLDRSEILGLAAILNSNLFDRFFRIINGNVNVSSTELRLMPLPPIEQINEIGNELILKNSYDIQLINQIVNEKLRFKSISKINEQD